MRDNLIKEEVAGLTVFLPLKADQVCRIRVPTLLIGVQHSPCLFARLLDHLEELLPDPERIEIPQASHLMHEENSEEYNRAMLSFLSGHREQKKICSATVLRPR